MDVPDKDELLRRWMHNDAVVYGCVCNQARLNLSDEQMLCAMVDLMAARHAHLVKAYEELLARTPATGIV